MMAGILVILAIILSPVPTAAMPPHPDALAGTSGPAAKAMLNSQKAWTDRGIDQPSTLLTPHKVATLGTFKALAVLIDFSDQPQRTAAFDFDTLLFADRRGTVRDYYRRMSFDRLDIVTVNLPSTIGWTRAPQTYEYYVDGKCGTGTYPHNTQRLCLDIIDLIDPIVDFSQYDNTGNGYVDALILIHTGSGAEKTMSRDDIWSHKWALPSARKRDGINILEYTIQPEYWYHPGDMTCGVYCHELGHVFGLPDLYDRDSPPDNSYGIGRWSIMSYGSWLGPQSLGGCPAGLDAWSRIQLGFNSSINVTANRAAVNLGAMINGGPIYRLWAGGSQGHEYFLVTNRRRTGYDSYLPGEGLLIWHIDDTKAGEHNSNNDDEYYPGYTKAGNYLVALEQADGYFQLEKGLGMGDDGDPFPGHRRRTAFGPRTRPSSDAYGGDNSGVSVTAISEPGDIMTADFTVSLSSDFEPMQPAEVPATFTLEQNYPNPFNPETIIAFNLEITSHVRLAVFDMLGRQIKNLGDGVYPAGEIRLRWDGTDGAGCPVASGVYLYELVTESGTDTKKMILMR